MSTFIDAESWPDHIIVIKLHYKNVHIKAAVMLSMDELYGTFLFWFTLGTFSENDPKIKYAESVLGSL